MSSFCDLFYYHSIDFDSFEPFFKNETKKYIQYTNTQHICFWTFASLCLEMFRRKSVEYSYTYIRILIFVSFILEKDSRVKIDRMAVK